jgi:hypothetical protein
LFPGSRSHHASPTAAPAGAANPNPPNPNPNPNPNLQVWVGVLKKVLNSMQAMHVQLDLEDKRRSV